MKNIKNKAGNFLVRTQNKNFAKMLTQLSAIGSQTNDPILLLGGTGTGKTVLVKEIHKKWCKENKNKEYSEKKDEPPFKDFNCATLNDSKLIQSTLFGHKKGSFTGAIKDRDGLVKSANGGTLFLDEIGELDLESQTKLLKTIESGFFQPVGSDEKEKSKFRLICATNKQLEKEIAAGKFRADLYSRIRYWVYRLPSLKDLPEDIEFFIGEKLDDWNTRKEKNITFNRNAKSKYLKFALSINAKWTGNFRDLKRSINRMATLASLETLGGSDKITPKIVDEEIKELNNFWKKDFENNLAGSELFNLLINRLNNDKLPFAYAVEKFIIENSIKKTFSNKAAASRLLYGNKTLNATAKLNERQKFLNEKK